MDCKVKESNCVIWKEGVVFVRFRSFSHRNIEMSGERYEPNLVEIESKDMEFLLYLVNKSVLHLVWFEYLSP